jgi:hypothetical protein
VQNVLLFVLVGVVHVWSIWLVGCCGLLVGKKALMSMLRGGGGLCGRSLRRTTGAFLVFIVLPLRLSRLSKGGVFGGGSDTCVMELYIFMIACTAGIVWINVFAAIWTKVGKC